MTPSPAIKAVNVEDDISPVNVGGKHVLIRTDVSTDAHKTPSFSKEKTSLTNTVLSYDIHQKTQTFHKKGLYKILMSVSALNYCTINQIGKLN